MVADSDINNSATDISIFGRTKLEYGRDMNANLLHILENCACPENLSVPGTPDLTGDIELGTNIGMGTIALAGGNSTATVYTIDGCSKTQAIAKENVQKMGLKNVHFIHQQFDDYLADLRQDSAPIFDLVFIDGNHRGEALKRYIFEIQPFIHGHTFLICDDIRWSNDMFSAWKSLENDPSFHVSLDCFKFGILLKRSEQVKEQFVVKIPNSLSGLI